MASSASFSAKGKNIPTEHIVDEYDIHSSYKKDLLGIFTLPLPTALQELMDDDTAFTQKYVQPLITRKVHNMDHYKILLRDQEIILIGIIKNIAYLRTLSDESDAGTIVKLSVSPYREEKYLFHFSAFEKIDKDKYFAVIRHKYPGFGVLAMEAFNIIDVAKKSAIPIPVEFTKGKYLTHMADEPIKKQGKSIIVSCSLTDDMIKYITGFDSWHDMLESRTIYGPHYYADCEIDTETGTMKTCQ